MIANLVHSLQVQGTIGVLIDIGLEMVKYEFLILKKKNALSYGISYIYLKSLWLPQENLEHGPFSTFCLIWQNSISKTNL